MKHCRKLSFVVFQARLSGLRVRGHFLAIGIGGVLPLVVAAPPNRQVIWLRLVDELSEAESEREISAAFSAVEQLRPSWWFMNDRATVAALVDDSSGDYKHTDYWRESGGRRIVQCRSCLIEVIEWAMENGLSRLMRMPSVQCKISALVRTCPGLQTDLIKQIPEKEHNDERLRHRNGGPDKSKQGSPPPPLHWSEVQLVPMLLKPG